MKIALAMMLVCGGAMAQGEGIRIDWDLLQRLPAKQIKSRIAELTAADVSTEGIALDGASRPDPVIIYENQVWDGATTHYAGIDIPNTFDMFSKSGKWTLGEWAAWGGTTAASVALAVVMDDNGGGSPSSAPEQAANITVGKGSSTATIVGCAGNAHAKISDHESGSGTVEAHCSQPTKQ